MPPILHRFRRLFEVAMISVVVTLMVAMTALVFFAVIFRKAGHSLSWYDEVASILLAWLTYYGAALAALKRSHIGFSGLVAAIPVPWRTAAVLAAEAITLSFFAVLAAVGYQVVVLLQGLTLVSLPWVPVSFTQSVIPIGAVLFIVAQILNWPILWREAIGRAPILDTETPLDPAGDGPPR
ncbi:MAG: TRAP transporter small permease subunit [Inquilinus sp.]|nr:TRAP transporter small permease subunit [Inquilinus sp.]